MEIGPFLDKQPYLISIGYIGSPGDAAYLLVPVKFTVAVTFPANFSGSYAIAQVAATAETILTINKNGSPCGTITFAASGTIGTFASSGGNPVSFADGDTMSVVNQATADATLADIGITLSGTR